MAEMYGGCRMGILGERLGECQKSWRNGALFGQALIQIGFLVCSSQSILTV